VLETPFFEACEAAAARWEVPALAVGVLAGGRAETFAVGCDAATRFTVASITKPFVAHLALELLDLDQPTGVWPDDVQIRHLLAHTSGFDCELSVPTSSFGEGDDALARCAAELPGVRRFVGVDEVWSYANSGYWLTGYLASVRAGTTFEATLANHVIGPAGLEATDFGPPDVAGTGDQAGAGAYPRARRPSGGLTSNVVDLLRFAQWHLAHPFSWRMRTVTAKPVRGVYGLGLFGERVDGVAVWGHPGSYGGYQSSLLMVPDRNAAFVGLTNSSDGGKALREVEDEFFAAVIGARRRLPELVALPPQYYESYAGTYVNTDNTWSVAHEGGDELVVSNSGDTFRARAVDEHSFYVPDGRHMYERFDFPRDGLGRLGSVLAERVA